MKIIYDNCLGTGPDCVSNYQCHLDKPVTLEEFFEYLESNENEVGDVVINSFLGRSICSYRKGKVYAVSNIAEQIKSEGRKIDVINVCGGYSRFDYVIKVIS